MARIEYLIPTDNIRMLFTLVWLQNLVLLTGFQYDLMIIQKWLTFYWAILYTSIAILFVGDGVGVHLGASV